jgi:hypothetical protein
MGILTSDLALELSREDRVCERRSRDDSRSRDSLSCSRSALRDIGLPPLNSSLRPLHTTRPISHANSDSGQA